MMRINIIFLIFFFTFACKGMAKEIIMSCKNEIYPEEVVYRLKEGIFSDKYEIRVRGEWKKFCSKTGTVSTVENKMLYPFKDWKGEKIKVLKGDRYVTCSIPSFLKNNPHEFSLDFVSFTAQYDSERKVSCKPVK